VEAGLEAQGLEFKPQYHQKERKEIGYRIICLTDFRTQAYDLSTWEAEAEGSQAQGQHGL
jgi:hypothetical protein